MISLAEKINKPQKIPAPAPIPAQYSGVGPVIAPLSESLRPLRRQIFERVRASGLLSRINIAKDLGISPATVTTLTSELIDARLLEEVDVPRARGDNGRGRPPKALGVRADAMVTAGLKLSDRDFSAVVVDFAGNLLASEAISHNPGALAPEHVLELCADILERVTARLGLTPGDLAAVGIGLPGFVEHESGKVHWSPLMKVRNFDFAQAAQARLGVPVVIDNDANLVTLAELWFGVGREVADFAVVTIEHGVGMGVVLNHKLYRGANGLGTELGHTKVQLDGALCRCGQRGCLEAYVADYALAREATTALDWLHDDGQSVTVTLESLFDHAKAGNAAARSIFHRAGRYLALGLANVINIFDPSLIVLSGERMRYDYLYSKETLAELKGLAVQAGRPAPKVEIHAWGDMLWAHGAAALALSFASERRLDPDWSMVAE